jgi:hypothetical protein
VGASARRTLSSEITTDVTVSPREATSFAAPVELWRLRPLPVLWSRITLRAEGEKNLKRRNEWDEPPLTGECSPAARRRESIRAEKPTRRFVALIGVVTVVSSADSCCSGVEEAMLLPPPAT